MTSQWTSFFRELSKSISGFFTNVNDVYTTEREMKLSDVIAHALLQKIKLYLKSKVCFKNKNIIAHRKAKK